MELVSSRTGRGLKPVELLCYFQFVSSRSESPSVIFLLALLIAAPAVAQERPGVAVLEMEAIVGVDKGVARLVNEILLARIGMSGVFGSVIGSSDIREMINLEQQKNILGCEEEGCIAQLGGALGVPLMIVPSLGKLGDDYLITLKITDVDEAKVLVRQILIIPDERSMAKGMAWVVKAALANYQGRRPPPEPKFQRAKSSGWTPPPWFRPAGMGLLAAGVLTSAASYVRYSGASVDYAGSNHRATPYRSYVDTTSQANQLLAAGLSLSAFGALLWRLAS
jgi:hypothetical protein